MRWKMALDLQQLSCVHRRRQQKTLPIIKLNKKKKKEQLKRSIIKTSISSCCKYGHTVEIGIEQRCPNASIWFRFFCIAPEILVALRIE